MAPVPAPSAAGNRTASTLDVPTPYGVAPALAVRLALTLSAATYALRIRRGAR
jgi:hypothetical protein